MLALWLVVRGVAAPGAPVVVSLPPGEDPSSWRNALALAGLATAGAPPSAVITGGARWRVVVTDADGDRHELWVAPPTDRAGREALASLIASLVHPVPEVPEVALPPLAPPPPRPPSRPEPPPAPDLGESLVVVPDDRLGESSRPAYAPPSPPLQVLDPAAPTPLSVHPWFGGGPAVRIRPELRSTVAAGVWGGAELGGRARAGLGVEGVLPAGLSAWDGAYHLAMVDLRALAAWAPARWELGATAGASVRSIVETPPAQVSPVVGAVIAHRFPLGSDAVRWSLSVEADLDRTGLDDPTDELAPTLLPPISAQLGVGWWTN